MTEVTAVLLMCVLGIIYFKKKKTDKIPALFCKAAATAVPGLLLLKSIPIIGSDISAVSLAGTLAAVCCYMAADVLLECHFVAGAAVFSAGHVFMAAGFLAGGETGVFSKKGGGTAGNVAPVFLIAGGTVLFIAAAVFCLHRHFSKLRAKKLFLPAFLYILILSLNASCAVAAGIYTGLPYGLISAAGGVCFVVSDILLGMNRLGKKRDVRRGAAVLALYYASVYLFTMRLWIQS